MPLLHRRQFTRLRPPVDLRPEEEVFLCKITHEVFRTYDEFFERTILCNSLVWSCALTGRAGLTYLEAVESERRAQQSLQNFPQALVVPLLHLVAVSRRCRLTELCEDVHAFVKERFFPGEVVDVTDRHGNRHVCEVLEVQSPHTSCNAATISKQPTGGDTIVISDSDEESPCPPKSPHPPLNGKRKKSISPSVFRYTVRKIPEGTTMTIKAVHISRRKNTLSKEKLKLLFKQHCEPQNGTIMLKASTFSQYKLGEHSFSQFFPDEPPKFPFSPPSKAGAGNHGDGLPGQLATQEKLKLLQEKEQMRASSHEKSRLKKEKEEEQMKTIQERIQLKREKEEEQESKRREREELRRRFEEDKLKRKEEKEKERIKLKEEKKKYAERLKLWNKPREDLECEDLKELPCPVPVQTRVPADLFGDVLMVLEFLAAFGEHFDLKDEFPDGVTLDVLEEALCGSDPEGPLCELLFFFLSAVFQTLEPQEDPDVEPDQEMSEVLEDDADPTESAVNAVASLAASWPLLHQGCGIKQLDLDSCTLSEILRLHILASGADCNHGNAKFRYQKQGGFLSSDDPCVELRLANPGLMKRLATTPVYDLSPGDKLCILQALLCKLLTLVESRELMEACGEELRAARHELRDLRCEQHRREREEAAHRVRLKKEERLREQEEKIKEEERNGVDQRSLEVVAEEEKKLSKVVRATETPSPSPLPFSSLSPEELEREAEKVRVLQAHVQQVASCTSLVPLGRDRLYRRYWLLPSSPALFVEDDCFGLTEDMLVPQPAPPREEREGGEDEEAEEEEEAGSSGPGSVSPSPPSGPPAAWPNRWAFYGSVEEVERLLEALNPRGHREGGLREALLQERDRLRLQLDATSNRFSQPAETVSSTPSAEVQMESRLRDLLLDLEERLYQGILGNIKVMHRVCWREALQRGQYDLICDEHVNGGLQPSLARLEELRGAEPGSATPTAVSCTVHCLARALVHVEQGIERKFLQPPLGEEEPRKDQKLKKKKLDEESSEDGSETSRVCKTVLERWRESLHTSSSLSQVFVHLSTLDRSVLWSRSLLNTRCKVCRRKGDADSMVLCDSCHRGNHTHCLRPKLKAVPEGDWFCPDCRPKQRSSRPAPRPSPPSQGRAEEDRSRQAPRSSASKATSRPTQGLPVATPKSSSTTNGKKSSSRSSGSASLPPPRSGTRTSARLSHEIEVPPAAQGGALNTSQTECSPPVKPSRPVLTPSSSSSSRRSSGRNHGVHQLSTCEQLAVDLVRHPDSWPFKKLVSRTQVPDYYDIIKTPIALCTIRERINSCDYQTSAGFIADVELMFSNCMQYNPRHTNEAKAGLRLQAFFQAELSRLGLTPPASPLASPPTKRSRL